MKHMNTLCGQKAELLIINAGGKSKTVQLPPCWHKGEEKL
jgi:hypothetical protein